MVLTKGHIPILAVRVFIFVLATNSVNTKLCKTLNDGKLMLHGGTLCVVSKGNGKVVLIFAMNAYRGSRGIFHHVLDLGARWRRVVNTFPGCLTPPGKNSGTH
jgi:hypothetical protein